MALSIQSSVHISLEAKHLARSTSLHLDPNDGAPVLERWESDSLKNAYATPFFHDDVDAEHDIAPRNQPATSRGPWSIPGMFPRWRT